MRNGACSCRTTTRTWSSSNSRRDAPSPTGGIRRTAGRDVRSTSTEGSGPASAASTDRAAVEQRRLGGLTEPELAGEASQNGQALARRRSPVVLARELEQRAVHLVGVQGGRGPPAQQRPLVAVRPHLVRHTPKDGEGVPGAGREGLLAADHPHPAGENREVLVLRRM